MINKILKTRTAEIFLGDDGIYRHKMLQNVQVNLEDAKELFAKNEELSDGTPRPLNDRLSVEAGQFFGTVFSG